MGKREKIFNIFFIIALAGFAALEFINIEFSADEQLSQMIKAILTRSLGGIFGVVLMLRLGYGKLLSPLGKPFWKPFFFILPCLLVCVNNFPFIGLLTGNAEVTSEGGKLALFGFECLSVGFFEETVFRGIILAMFLEKARDGREIFKAVIISSALFGGVHLFNLLAGAGPLPTLLQVVYSFLMGGMWAVVLLIIKSIWSCVAMHAIYNFGGMLISNHGAGLVWDPYTVAVTAIIGIAVGVYVLFYLFKKADTKGLL